MKTRVYLLRVARKSGLKLCGDNTDIALCGSIYELYQLLTLETSLHGPTILEGPFIVYIYLISYGYYYLKYGSGSFFSIHDI